MNSREAVKQLVKKYFWEMSDDASLNTGAESVLPEDALDFFAEYFESLQIDSSGFHFCKYFPNEGVWFLPNAVLPDYLKTDHHRPEPLTIKMLIASAESGHWLEN